MNRPSYRMARSMHELHLWRDQWNAMADAQRLPLARYGWFLSAEEHLAEKGCVRIIYVVDDENRLTAAAALEIKHDSDGHPNYHILGMPRLYEPSAILHHDDASKRDLLRSLTSLGKPVILARLWPDDHGITTEDSRFWLSLRALWIGKNSAPSQYLDLSLSYEEYVERLPSQRRYDLRRAYKRSEPYGTVAPEFIHPTPDNIDEILNLAFEIESRSWKGSQGCSILANDDLRLFFSDMLRHHAVDGGVLIGLLRIGNKPVATQICLVAHDRLWILKIGYDQEFQKLSPGLMLMNEIIKYSYNVGLCGIEFLGSAESWVDAWRPELRHYRLLAVYPYNTTSLTSLGRAAAGTFLRRFRRDVQVCE